MALVTEALLREQFGETNEPGIERYELPAGTIVTPSARAWLVDHHIDLIIGGVQVWATPKIDAEPESASSNPTTMTQSKSTAQPEPASSEPASALPEFHKPDHFDVIDGSRLENKPEHLTALRGNLLVPKNHPQIKFRGMLDAFEADVVSAQVAFVRLGLTKGVADLGQILAFVKQILRAEVLDQPLEDLNLLGLSDTELREHSHHPKQYYGIPHFAATAEDGEAVVLLNQLRTRVRQAELAAYDAFTLDGATVPTRIDIIRALNRLSSAVYLMMFKAKTGEYA